MRGRTPEGWEVVPVRNRVAGALDAEIPRILRIRRPSAANPWTPCGVRGRAGKARTRPDPCRSRPADRPDRATDAVGRSGAGP
jgi:hypothetical protein